MVATHLSFLDRGLYFARCHPERSYVVAGRTADLPAAMYLSTESPAHSIRAHGDWLLVGGESHKTGQADAAERFERLSAWARERFGLEPELRWATQDQMPVDGVPYVGRHDPVSRNLWVATAVREGSPASRAASKCGRASRAAPKRESSTNPSRWRMIATCPAVGRGSTSLSADSAHACRRWASDAT